jgi:hypothetical protein
VAASLDEIWLTEVLSSPFHQFMPDNCGFPPITHLLFYQITLYSSIIRITWGAVHFFLQPQAAYWKRKRSLIIRSDALTTCYGSSYLLACSLLS